MTRNLALTFSSLSTQCIVWEVVALVAGCSNVLDPNLCDASILLAAPSTLNLPYAHSILHLHHAQVQSFLQKRKPAFAPLSATNPVVMSMEAVMGKL